MSETNTMQDIFGDVIYAVTRADLIADGTLVDMTEWGSAEKGFIGGWRGTPVACSAAVWADLNAIGKSCGDVRGRAHDMLFMGKLALDGAVRRANAAVMAGNEAPPEVSALFQFIMQVGRKKLQTYKIVLSPDENDEPVVTFLLPSED